jgi:DNA-binding IclR family transcriptional regulator
MPAERTTIRQVREVLGLTTAGVGLNEIAHRVGVAPSTVRLTLKRLASAGLSWPLPAEMTDSALEAALFAAVGTKQGHRRRAEPHWAVIHHELKRKHVTLAILWDEYIERYLTGITIRAAASCTAVGLRGCRSRSGKAISAATSCLSMEPVLGPAKGRTRGPATRCR